MEKLKLSDIKVTSFVTNKEKQKGGGEGGYTWIGKNENLLINQSQQK